MRLDPKELTRALGGRWHGTTGRALCPVCGGSKDNPPLAIGRGRDGGAVLHCWKGCAFTEVARALYERGLGDDDRDAWAAQHAHEADRQAEDMARKKVVQARACWGEAQPIQGTLAERYLRGRAITCALPDTLRFHPAAWHGPSARRLPALVALVEGGPDFAVHRTYLDPVGGKAKVMPAKMALGPLSGGAVRLAQGEGRLAVAEGIETALSLACGLLNGSASIWATLGTAGMAGLDLPPTPGRLTIATDSGAPGRAAGAKLAERAHRLGWSVGLLPAPEGKDWNDILQMRGAA